MAQPTTIPFSGEYWLYRLPYKQPPRGSYKRRGSPAKLFFHTTQGDPLSMEAKQKLDLTSGAELLRAHPPGDPRRRSAIPRQCCSN